MTVLPPNVLVRRDSPGVYSVRMYRDLGLFGRVRGYVGRVRRDRVTRLWTVDDDDTGTAHLHRDVAVAALLDQHRVATPVAATTPKGSRR